MKVAALLSFFDESPAWLARCAASVARCCDHLVAVDGRYALYPSTSVASPAECHHTLVDTCRGANLPLTLHVPTEPFYDGEIEKRNLTLDLARSIGCDWVVVVDADEYVEKASSDFRRQLAVTDEHACTYRLVEFIDLQAGHVERLARSDHSFAVESTSVVRAIYRLHDTLRYVGTHYHLEANVDGEHLRIWGQDPVDDIVPARDLTKYLTVVHTNRHRAASRRNAAAKYYMHRDRVKAEIPPWQPPISAHDERNPVDA